jgi:hypothetical protein
MDTYNNLIRIYNTQTTYASTYLSIRHPYACEFIGNDLYVSFNYQIGMISNQAQLNTISGSNTYGYQDGYGTSVLYKYPNQFTSYSNSILFICDFSNSYIRQLNLISTQVISFYYIPTNPNGIAIDSTNSYLYVTSYYSPSIIQITISTRVGIVYTGSTIASFLMVPYQLHYMVLHCLHYQLIQIIIFILLILLIMLFV